ncbi:MAG: 4-vinyl reductase [Candidatus Micrarchaeota archaeon]|nr:4-vinyl reductase [Candidatus Micrarchaeota archaeon]MDE1847892.1 4-vinyl reductase [Candidatus Micrarchaeota archaeon]MDE1864518.1 4-vinyl reductase [Candidatus Micrarchaeota archaeon]
MSPVLSNFEHLMTTGQIVVKDGDIEMMGNRMIMPNSKMLSELIFTFNDSKDIIYKIYEATKKSFMEGTATEIGKKYEFDFHGYFEWLTKIAMIVGWGKFTWEILDEEKKIGQIVVEDSAIANDLKGMVTRPVDHFIRGLIAGGASISLKANIDVIEEECIALGASKCKFLFKPSDQFEQTDQIIFQLRPTQK